MLLCYRRSRCGGTTRLVADPTTLRHNVGDKALLRARRALYHVLVTLSRAVLRAIWVLESFALHKTPRCRGAMERGSGIVGRLQRCLAGLPKTCRDITPAGKSDLPSTSPPRTLFAPAVLEHSSHAEETCMRGAQWLLVPVKPIC